MNPQENPMPDVSTLALQTMRELRKLQLLANGQGGATSAQSDRHEESMEVEGRADSTNQPPTCMPEAKVKVNVNAEAKDSVGVKDMDKQPMRVPGPVMTSTPKKSAAVEGSDGGVIGGCGGVFHNLNESNKTTPPPTPPPPAQPLAMSPLWLRPMPPSPPPPPPPSPATPHTTPHQATHTTPVTPPPPPPTPKQLQEEEEEEEEEEREEMEWRDSDAAILAAEACMLKRYSQQLTYHRKRVMKLESFMSCFGKTKPNDGEPPIKKAKFTLASTDKKEATAVLTGNTLKAVPTPRVFRRSRRALNFDNVPTDNLPLSRGSGAGDSASAGVSACVTARVYPVVNGVVEDGEVAGPSGASAGPALQPPCMSDSYRYSDISDADDTSGLSLVAIAPTEAAAAEVEPVVLTWGEAEGQEEEEDDDEDECSCCSDNLSWLKDLTLHDWSGEYLNEIPAMEQGLEGLPLYEKQGEMLFLDMLYERNIIGGGDISMEINVEQGAVEGAEGLVLDEKQREMLFLDMLYEQNIIGEGDISRGVNVEQEAEEGVEGDIEPHMIFDGPDYVVNFHRHIEVRNVKDIEFDGGIARETVYRVHFNVNWAGVNLRDIMGGLEEVLEAIIARLHESYSSHDLVRFFIQNEAFYSPHTTGLIPLHQLTIFKIIELMESLLQSDEDLYLDEPLEIHVGIIRNPLAAGVSTGVNYIEDLRRLKSICEIKNRDNLCLARAIVVGVAKANVDATPKTDKQLYESALNEYKRVQHGQKKAQTIEAQRLHTAAGFDLKYVPSFTDIPSFERVANTRVVVFGRGSSARPLYVGDDHRQRTVYLLYECEPLDKKAVGHFHTITKVNCIFAKSSFCEKCLKAYDARYGHTGCDQCPSCKGESCVVISAEKHSCPTCNRFMRSDACSRRHHENGTCSSSHRCRGCGVFHKSGDDHKCGTRECSICKKLVTGVHFCYIRQQKPKAVSCKYIFADFEADPTGKFHLPNLLVAHWECSHCIELSYRDNPRCSHCGTACAKCSPSVSGNTPRGHDERELCMKGRDCGRRGVSFFGDDAATDFCQFLFRREFEGYTLIFHNGQAYDAYFMAKYIFSTMRKLPRVIYRGSKIVAIDAGKFRVIDSLNFLTFPLAQMPKVFGLKGVKKGTFPVFFNQKEMWDFVGPIPHPYCYRVNRMKSKAREEFMAWYKQQRGKVFDFKKEIMAYCEDDVNILQESCNAFRSWLISITSREEVVDVGEGGETLSQLVGIDPFQYITLASVCMATYRHMFLTEKYSITLEDDTKVVGHLQNAQLSLVGQDGRAVNPSTAEIKSMEFVSTPFARMPSCGFGGLDAHSRVSIIWLEYEALTRDLTILHARNGGEHKVINQTRDGWLKLDGYHVDQVTGKETAWEFHGCVYHGCRRCFGGPNTPANVRHPHTGESLKSLYRRTEARLVYLRSELNIEVHVMWECEFKQLLETSEALREVEQNCELLPRLDPRAAFYGGRVNAVKLYHEAQEGKRIGYVDICSLYPMVLKNDVFPVGIPEVIIDPPLQDIGKYFGIVQARVRPPRGLYHPCLPLRVGGKLLFPLCSRCARNSSQEPCRCPDTERDLVGTWTSIDLRDALSVGYTIVKVFEIYHFEETAKFDKTQATPGLFSDYVNLFLKGKQEASGWPSDDMTDAEKTEYIDQYESVEGIRLDTQNISYNPGKRATNKLLLNSFWGKFGENNNHRTHKLAETGADIFKLLVNPSISLKGMHVLDSNRCMLEYTHTEGFLPEMPHVNVFIAAFTTANARSRLFNVLHNLGRRVLYFDTDSVVYEYTEGDTTQYTPDMGDHLGQWTNELKANQFISRFVSSGPKSYAYLTNDDDRTTKLKGFTLNHEVCKLLNFDSICRLVLFWADPDNNSLPDEEQPRVEVPYSKIRRDKYAFKLFNRDEIKKFRVTYSKRCLVLGTYDTLPFGF